MKEHESRVSDSAAATPRSELHLQDIQIEVEEVTIAVVLDLCDVLSRQI